VKHLAEIARIVERAGDPTEKVFIPGKRTKDRPLGMLFQAAVSGEYTTDEAAAQNIFDTTPQSAKYSTAKSRLKRRLLNSLILLNLKRAGYTKPSQTEFACYRALFLIHALQILGARRVAMRMAEYFYMRAEPFHLTHVQLELAQFLRFDASIKKLPSAFRQWSDASKKHISDLGAENLALDLFAELELHHNRRLISLQELQELATTSVATLDAMQGACSTLSYQTNYFRIKHMQLDLVGKGDEVVKVCDDALSFFQSFPEFSSGALVSEFAFRKLYASLKIRDIDRGEEAYKLAIVQTKPGTNNWFALQSYYVLLQLHSSRFENARDILVSVLDHPRFTSLPTPVQEIWKLYELHVLYATDRLEEEGGKVTKVKPSQRLEVLLNVAPTLSQDKQGHKVSLLILHILYLLEIGDFNGIIDRMEALKLYRARYLKASQFPKTASFFKLLQIMENNSFNYKLVKEKGEKEYEKLIQSTENQEEINEGLQILPYDWLWLKILDRLKEYDEKFAKRGL
jgi:hypothetical protein